jgi:hypothetical protein
LDVSLAVLYVRLRREVLVQAMRGVKPFFALNGVNAAVIKPIPSFANACQYDH